MKPEYMTLPSFVNSHDDYWNSLINEGWEIIGNKKMGYCAIKNFSDYQRNHVEKFIKDETLHR